MQTVNTSTVINSFHTDLRIAKELVYDKVGLAISNLEWHAESIEYGACSFVLNGKTVQHRVSKITPTKTGQFVTIWKRNKDGITEPFAVSDNLDFIIVTSKFPHNTGQFIFPKSVLAARGIITQNGKEGKRGIRVYPPWDIVTSKQAEKTQSWQTKYFLPIKNNNETDLALAKKLLDKTCGLNTM